MKLRIIFKSILALTITASLFGCSDDNIFAEVSPEIPELSSTLQTKQVETELQVEGSAIDGYLTNSIVCLDLNKNGYCDLTTEPATTTDENGAYSLNVTDYKSHPNFDTAQILLFDGFDSDTGKRFLGKLFSPQATEFENTSIDTVRSMNVNITAVSTLVAKLIDVGETLDNAKTKVKAALSIPDNIDVSDDPIALIKNNTAGAAEFIGKNIALNRSINILVAAASQDNALSDKNDSQISDSVFKALAATIKSQQPNSTTEPKDVETLFTKMAKDPEAKKQLNSTVLEKASTVAAIAAKKTKDIYANTPIKSLADAQVAAVNATKVETSTSALVKPDVITGIITIKLDDTFDETSTKTHVESTAGQVKQITLNDLAIEFLTLAGINLTEVEKTALSELTELANQSPFTLDGIQSFITNTPDYADSTALKSIIGKISAEDSVKKIDSIPEIPSIVPGKDIVSRTVTTNITKIQEKCPLNGGIQLDIGTDTNANGILEDSEVVPSRTLYICHAEGISVTNAEINQAGELVLTLSNNTSINAGEILNITTTDADGVLDINQYLNGTQASTLDTDGDGVSDLVDAFPNNAAYSQDSDNDGLPDDWEMSTFGNLTKANETTDFDGDGVLDIDEYKNGTQASTPDTDGDGVSDLVDAFPNNATYSQDSDSDGLPDNWELLIFGNLTLADSSTDYDADGVLDIDEYKNDTQAVPDTDGDGVSDLVDAFPNNADYSQDSDSDGLPDNWELLIFGNLTLADSSTDYDADGVLDIDEYKNDTQAVPDTDGDGVSDLVDAFPNNATYSQDSDSDGLPDNWELLIFGNLTLADSSTDYDADGVLDIDEYKNDTQAVPDTDGDGVSDLVDAFPNNADYSQDSDSDGLPDNWELLIFGNLTLADSSTDYDADGVLDIDEYKNDTQAVPDTDGDGVSDLVDAFPNNAAYSQDSDNDGLPDNWELLIFGNLTLADSSTDYDADGVLDIDEYKNDTQAVPDTDGDGVSDLVDAFPNNATYSQDSDSDGLPDNWELLIFGNLTLADSSTDYDADGVLDIDEYKNGTQASTPDTDGDGVSDLVDAFPNNATYSQDSDSDGLPDNWELLIFGNLTKASAITDFDGDGILDIDEYKNGTQAVPDTDGDGVSDLVDAFPNNATYSQDSDSDGLPDNWELLTFGNLTKADSSTDYDADGVLDIDEYKNGTQAVPDTDGDGVSDLVDVFPNNAAYSQDSNVNGLPDEWEQSYAGLGMLPPQDDQDGDGYTNLQEFQNSTDPTVADFNVKLDYVEVIAGQSTSIDVLANDSLGSGTVTVSAVTQPSVGSLTIEADNTLTYTSATTDGGNQMVEVSVTDGSQTLISVLIIRLLDANTPTLVEVSTGTAHSLMLMSDGSVYAWGANSNGQLGDGSTTNQTIPVLANINNVAAVFATGNRSYVTLNDGSAWELGATNTQLMMAGGVTPLMNVQKFVGASSILIEGYQPYALDSQGNVYSLKSGTAYSTNNVSVVYDTDGVTPLTGIVDLAAPGSNELFSHALALRNTGEVIAWGNNYYGQLGNGTNTNSLGPVVVSNLTNIVQIAAAKDNSYAVDNLGDVYAWGSMRGIGDGNSIDRNVPVKVPNVSNVTTLNVGLEGSFPSVYAQTSANDTIWGQASSNNHLLAYSYFASVPTAITAYKPTTISIGEGFSVFTENNTMYAIGLNDQGQLGDGSTVTSSSPVKVVLSSDSVVSGAQGENFEWGIIPPRWASSSWLTTQDTAVVQEGLTSVEVADALTDNQSATLEANVSTAAGDVTFQYKVSSEQYFDTLTFSVDGVVQASYSGEVPWTLSVNFPVTAGQHKLTWTYSKDGSASIGQDKAWVDDIQFPLDSDKDGVSDLLDAAPYDKNVQ